MLNWGSRLRCKLLVWEPTLEDGNQNPVEPGKGTGGKVRRLLNDPARERLGRVIESLAPAPFSNFNGETT
ncbi:MAG: hypothetical protein ACYCQJ_15960 [Nitrososphaerales archaeon]